MATKNSQRSVYTYADWNGIGGPKLMGVLNAASARGKKISL